MTLPLSTKHREDLYGSGLSDAQIEACRFATVGPGDVQRLLHWKSYGGNLGSCLRIPYRDIDGNVNGYSRLKPDCPRKKDERTVKYEAPVGMPNRAYFPPNTVQALKNPAIPLLLTEGEKKSAKADQEGFPCIGLPGVWNWQKKRQRDEHGKGIGPRELIDDLAAIAWQDRDVCIAFDFDPNERTTSNVQFAAWHLAQSLIARGAKVKCIQLPAGAFDDKGVPGKMGLDDYLLSHTPDDLRKLIVEAHDPKKPERLKSGLPEIVCNRRQLRDITADAVAAIQKANDPPRVFQRGGVLQRLRVDRGTQTPSLQVMDENALRGFVARVCDCIKVTKKGDVVEVSDVPPPVELVRDIASLPEWDLPALRAVVEVPAFSSAGTLVSTAGYHPDSLLWYHPARGLEIPPVPNKPSRADIDKAKSLLLIELYGDFPFKDNASKVHALAALMLAFVREMIDGPTPLHLFDAPVEGTGKTLLTTVIAIVSTGRPIEAIAEGTCEEEWRKRITAVLAEGPTNILIDNLTRTVDSGALASVLTTRVWKDRVLGHSKTATLPNTAVWMGSGNNTRLSRELIRRTVWCRIDSKTDAPWERTGFRHPNLIQWAKENRGQLIWAALVLCQAWITAGKPAGKQSLGMFESWAETIGGIFDVAEIPGLLANAKDFRATSTDRFSEWRSFVLAWWEKYQTVKVGVIELFDLAIMQRLLDSVLGDKEEKSQRTRLGLAMGKQRDRVYGEFRVVGAGEDHKGRQVYQLERTEVVPTTTQPSEVCEWTA